jgi:citrate lyase beta subunit
VVADLEDAVAPAEKDAARELACRLLAETSSSCGKAVRVNGAGTPHFAADLEALAGLPLDAIVLPKASPDAVTALGPEGPPVLAIVETALGLRLAYEIACEPRVASLVLGAVDLGAELGLEPRPDGQEILYARSKLVVDSVAAEKPGPFDVVYLGTRDEEGLEREALLARSVGMRGKACIHPAQLPVVNRVFAPSEQQLAWARSVIGTYEEALTQGRGAVALDGEMIDAPVVARARTLLERATRETA